jgi:hypothetical protein
MGTGKNFRQWEGDSGGAWLRKFKPVPIFAVRSKIPLAHYSRTIFGEVNPFSAFRVSRTSGAFSTTSAYGIPV